MHPAAGGDVRRPAGPTPQRRTTVDDLLTAQQIRTIQANITRCGQCRARLDLARQLGRDDPELRDRIDHLEAAGRAALDIHTQAKQAARR